jgi:hypothetical protein
MDIVLSPLHESMLAKVGWKAQRGACVSELTRGVLTGVAQIARVNRTMLPPGRLLPADQAPATEAEGGKVASILEQMFGPAMLRTTLLLWLVFFNVACIYYVRPPPSF